MPGSELGKECISILRIEWKQEGENGDGEFSMHSIRGTLRKQNGHERSYNLTEELNMIAKLKGPQCESIIVRNVNAKYRIITWK